ncbi:MAG: hypothetical protein AB7F19_04700 [Candidatus Babeliales bacterium]
MHEALFFLIAACLVQSASFAMKKPNELTAKEKEQREQAFEARMMAMRLEQTLRKESGNQEVPKVEVVEYGHGTIDCGQEGISREDLISTLKQARAKYETENPQPKGEKPPAIFSTCSTPKLIADYAKKGYLAYPQEDGSVGFCLPGHEQVLSFLLKAHLAATLNAQNK